MTQECLDSNREIADGRADRHAIVYRRRQQTAHGSIFMQRADVQEMEMAARTVCRGDPQSG